MKHRTHIAIVFVSLILVIPARAQYQEPEEFKRLGQSSMTFLDIDVGARIVGMGGAYTCMDHDVTAMFGNPAGIAGIDGGALCLNNTRWIADINQYALAAAFGTPSLGTFGLSFMMFDNGRIERTIPTKDLENHPEGFLVDGSYTVNQWVVGLAYARQITNKFSVGGQIKYCYEDLGPTDIVQPTFDDTTGFFSGYETVEGADNIQGVFALDFGTIYYFGFKDLRIGMSLRNFSEAVTYSFESFNLPITYRIALAMNVLSLISDMENHNLQFTLATVSPYDGAERLQVGGEYTFADLISFRAGYKSNMDIGALSAGFGLSPKAFGTLNLRLDYAYSEADQSIGDIHRFSVGFSF
ncbi:MAG: PorV/PorQ family protein [Fidelibacterota bacterium]|nr:MAG: PorV/PorQ family protein [Candidatus Neomarinimicrobiota bacterium]